MKKIRFGLLSMCFAIIVIMSNFLCSKTLLAELVHIEHTGEFWVDTNTIRHSVDNYYPITTVKVYYGMNKSRVFEYRFLYGFENGWWCKNPGSVDKWLYVKADSSDKMILDVILNNDDKR